MMKNKLFGILPFLMAPMGLFADGTSAAPENNMMRTLMFFGIVLVFFYLILWRPEQKRRKQMTAQRDSLKVGDKVTAMGILGEVFQLNDNTVILKMYDGAKIEVLKAAISQVHQTQEKNAKASVKEAAEVASK